MKPKEPESDCNQVKRRLCEFLKKREEELISTHENLQFIDVNQEGYYYSDEGLQGVWYRSKDLQDADIKSFLTSDWITNENQMVFARKLQSQLVFDGSIITHFILIRSMEEMAPYFRSSAFSNQSTTYVVDSNGTKMFEDTAVEELRILAVILLLILASVLFVTKFRNSSHPLAKKIPILAMTANAFSEDVQNAFNAGMNAHIVKPVDMKVLIKTVRNLQTGAGAAGTLN